MQHIRAIFVNLKARPATSCRRPETSPSMPACGCLPVFGLRRLKKLSRSTKELQAAEHKLQRGIDNLTVYQTAEQEAVRADRIDLIWQQQVLQHQLEQMQQQIDNADSVIVQIQVLPNSKVKCAITAAQLQPADQPVPLRRSDDEIAPTRCSSSASVIALAGDDSQVESDVQDTNSSSGLNMSDADVHCDVVLADSNLLLCKLHKNVKGSVRTYSSKLTHWCKKALVTSNMTDTKAVDVANKVSSRRRGSSNNGRRTSALDWGSVFTSSRRGAV